MNIYHLTRYCFPDTRIGQPVAAGTKCIWQCPGQSSYHQVKVNPITVLQPVWFKENFCWAGGDWPTSTSHPVAITATRHHQLTSSITKSSSDQMSPSATTVCGATHLGRPAACATTLDTNTRGRWPRKTQFLVILCRVRWCATLPWVWPRQFQVALTVCTPAMDTQR